MGSDKKKAEPKKADKKREKKSVTTLKAQIHCQACLTKIKKAVAKLEGIELISVDEKNQKITVVGMADAQQVMKAVKKTGKNVQLIELKEEKEKEKKGKQKEYKKEVDEDQEEIQIREPTPDYRSFARKSERISDYPQKSEHEPLVEEENTNNCSLM